MPTAEALRVGKRKVALSKLKGWDRNPRKISDARLQTLKDSLAADPAMLEARPLIATPEGEVVCGNMRLRAARELGWKDVPTFVVELDEDRKREWALRDNNEFGEWVPEEVGALLAEYEGDVALLGFDDSEINSFLAAAAGYGQGGGGDPDSVPERPGKPISKAGDLWLLGDHLLLCGDATSPGSYERLGKSGDVDLVLTDPPYNVDYEGKVGRRLAGDDQPTEEFLAFITAALEGSASIARAGAAFYVFYAHAVGITPRAALDAGYDVRQVLIWVKDRFVLSRSDYHWQHEPILYGVIGKGRRWFGGRKVSTIVDDSRPLEDWSREELEATVHEMRALSSAIREPAPRASALHPTMKPVDLLRRLIRNSCKAGGIVLDPFGGSGSTLIACEQMQMRSRLIELDPGYCDVIVQRWEDFTGGKAQRG